MVKVITKKTSKSQFAQTTAVSTSCTTPVSTSCATPVSTSCATPVSTSCATPGCYNIITTSTANSKITLFCLAVFWNQVMAIFYV
ncbi:uncharacterized protein LOC124812307 isoform X5 [Hydra vulgaris]|uniref:uncharacterized protein LOC124812307 isoform X4 n=1 Tax=Hydra vulgaris TaxID=6087 RepID=UPI001F5FA7E8|nr:probable GPI-anchored adhesin-like protein PGA18 isoform X4 [Hydra vulgaris]XP_047134715.1 probable GPI-anchored adhesin-like protein PGA18 isoform X6 [Hydra vulgaris]XP_047134716.1 probable GPI-anchored adhesin-like protein PGA18 isoform X7 [Hydra vulgaris]